jgi:methylated-DNA-[protein]-cysteine S-methyltransferase
MTTAYAYEQIPSGFGAVGLVWVLPRGEAGPAATRILLPREGVEMRAVITALYPGAVETSHVVERFPSDYNKTGRQIERFMAGEAVNFSLDVLDLKVCGAFQQRVLRLEFQIPRGRVSTYGRLAGLLDHPRAARAVGTALARNPFPIVIPCHRAIREDGQPGGFGGGLRMKRALLEMEDVAFDRRGRVEAHHLWP